MATQADMKTGDVARRVTKHLLALAIGCAILGGVFLLIWMGPIYGGAILLAGMAYTLGRGVIMMLEDA